MLHIKLHHSSLLYITQIPAALCALAASSAFEWGIVRAAAGAATKILDDVAMLDGGLPVRYCSKRFTFYSYSTLILFVLHNDKVTFAQMLKNSVCTEPLH
jgi:hypothetical protein